MVAEKRDVEAVAVVRDEGRVADEARERCQASGRFGRRAHIGLGDPGQPGDGLRDAAAGRECGIQRGGVGVLKGGIAVSGGVEAIKRVDEAACRG